MCTENRLRNKFNSVKGRITLILHSDLSCTGQGKKDYGIQSKTNKLLLSHCFKMEKHVF